VVGGVIAVPVVIALAVSVAAVAATALGGCLLIHLVKYHTLHRATGTGCGQYNDAHMRRHYVIHRLFLD